MNKIAATLATTAGCLSLVVSLGACGTSSKSSTASSATGSAAATSGATSYGHGSHRSGRGVSGVISGVSGSTVTVQDAQGNSSSVMFGSSTKFENEQPGSQALVTVGACVSARPDMSQWSGSSSSKPSAPHTFASSFTAGTVTVMPASTCAGGAAGGFGASGKVTSVSGNTFTMTTTRHARSASGSSSASASGGETRKETVTMTGSTIFTKEVPGSSKSLVAGMCLSALGAKKGSSAPARSMVISQSNNGVCGRAGGSGA